MLNMRKTLLLILLNLSLLSGFTTQTFAILSAGASENISHAAAVTGEQARNLQKLCKVWGFVKYTHMAFLTGEKDWDEELLNLIPAVQSASEEEVNDILYDWFISLGDDGYGKPGSLYVQIKSKDLNNLTEQLAMDINEFIERTNEISWLSFNNFAADIDNHSLFIRVEESRLLDFQEIVESLDWVASLTLVEEVDMRSMTDMGWIADTSYLGEPLVSVLSRFQEISIVDRKNAPVSFDQSGNSFYSNEKKYSVNMKYNSAEFRLLGLFRLWNAMEYYYPYRDILDKDWNELLIDFIPRILEDTDKLSYQLTLAALTRHLHDNHIRYDYDTSCINEAFGSYLAPILLAIADGKFVVSSVSNNRDCPLMRGDVLLRLDGKDIYDVSAEMLQYLSYPNDERALDYIVNYKDILRSHAEEMEVSILRDDKELKLMVKGYRTTPFTYLLRQNPNRSHELIENNIGLINPEELGQDQIYSIMKEFTDTDGLIIDLRPYPSDNITYSLAGYLVDKAQPFVKLSTPSQSIPGKYIVNFQLYSGGGSEKYITGKHNPDIYFYDKKVVLLMDITTASHPEFAIMSLRNGSNVTVMGSNSMGADGNVTYLPLPGGITMMYTGLGVYTPEGGQTQRIGLSPDIYVERTIEGIKEGRDELMEAAIDFILE